MTQPFSRKSTLIALGAALSGTMLQPARADAIPLRVGILPTSSNAPFYAAQKLGYFAAENLAVTAEVIRGGAAAIPGMLSGSLDICYSNGTSIAEAIARGIDLRLLIQPAVVPLRPPDPAALLKRKSDTIRTGKDLEGKIVAVNALRDVQWMFAKAWISQTGGDPEKTQLIEVALPAMVEAIKQKRIDSAVVIDPLLTVALGDPGIEVLGWPMSTILPGGGIAFFAVTADMTQRRPSDLRAFVRAWRRGAAWINANQGKEPFVDLVADFSGLNPDMVRRMRTSPAGTDVRADQLPRFTALMRQSGLLDANVDLRTKIFT
jgi:NitT/TauT family transport system substrate-binding protein